MKLEKPEWAAVIVTLAALTAMGGFFLGSRTAARPVTVSARSVPASAVDGAGTVLAGEDAVEMVPADEEPPSAGGTDPSEEFSVDINTATAEELQTLPGIGTGRAQAIVDDRREHGPFRYVEDLLRVKGIGEGVFEEIKDYITVGEQSDG